MELPRRRILQLAAGAAALGASRGAFAQAYPSSPIKFIVPYPPGGPTDLVARIVADKMREPLGQPVIVENVTGGGGNIGVGRVARATPDGYTLILANNGAKVLNGALYTLPYDVLNDFEAVARLTTNPQVIVSKKAIPANNLKELIAWVKENQATISLGTAGALATVSATHFQTLTGTKFVLVPYRGAAPAIQDLIGGRIELMFDQLSNAVPHIQAGTIKAYAITASTRSPSLPDVPTVDEAGLPGFHTALWQALWAPKGTPPAVIAKLNAAVVQALADPAVKERLAKVGQMIVPAAEQTPAALTAAQKAEADKWWPVIKAANIKGD